MNFISKLCALAVMCVLAGPVLAQDNATPDVSVDDATPATPDDAGPEPATNWAGGYFGITLGSRSLEADWTTTESRTPAGDPFDSTQDLTESVASSDTDLGIFTGYNWDMGAAWVIGVEADIHLMENEDKINRIPGLGAFVGFPPGSFVEIRAEDGTSLRGRVGYSLTPGLLLYGTAGLATLDIGITATCPADIFACDSQLGHRSFNNTKKMNGNTLGVGAEFAVGNSVLRAEYRIADFGDFSFTALHESEFNFGADATLEVNTEIFQIGLVNDF
jgi:outer membrane immunogenic protein